ncbi:primosomal protein N' [Acidaminobacter sp. JC074]|uniref:primosomal protein N' n=1 Tax=Acidaminobacter sp. JC074 TaxID=2530199 RepID=UPI001F119132|nr:primosomal protein N' [Acidaminobacter sp. JC074]MCH4890257.1 primosomal protein N' [Acidaminobacter sp. JC074]
MYAKVILTKHAKAIDMAFTYKVPEQLYNKLIVGQKVIVPFGQGDNLTEAFVVEITNETEFDKLKDIHQIVYGFYLTESQVALIEWMKETYLCTYSEALNAMVPSKTKLKKIVTYTWVGDELKGYEDIHKLMAHPLNESDIFKYKLQNRVKTLIKKGFVKKHELFKYDMKTQYKQVVFSNPHMTYEQAAQKLSKRAHKQLEVLQFIYEVGQCDASLLNKEINCNMTILKKLASLDVILLVSQEKFRKPDILNHEHEIRKHPLTQDQQVVYEAVLKGLHTNQKYLLHGVTGSGKTEVYLTLAEEIISRGQQVIILVPEIALTPQMVTKFVKRFGSAIAIMHSKVSPGERYDQYRSIQEGLVNIVIGARSAIFAPCPNLGLVILDEEHETTYKSDSNPKYHTSEVAEYLSDRLHFPVMLASATPRLSTYQKIGEKYELLELLGRYNKQPLPPVHLVDMREELIAGNKSMFSELLIEKIEDRLEKNEQVILFYNRKGFSTFVSCRSCGYALKCPRCDIALTYHHRDNSAKCSYCDYQIKVPKNCPECDSKYFKYFGAGTEKVELMLHELFPTARIGRLDAENTRLKGSLEALIEQVENHEIDILIGTQMVTKGLDFKNVTLVGTLSADMTLNLPDYRAPEKTFQLLTQVAGRAGRGHKHGEVVVQTYVPDHYAIAASVNHDYYAFYDEEMKIREFYHYPPHTSLVNLILSGENEKNVIDSAMNLSQELTRFLHKRIDPEHIEILGPNPALFQKLNNKYRWQIILKFDKMNMVLVRNILHYVCIQHKDKVVRHDVYINININPMSLL